jgi:D-glycero-D-manno-heptose 1,7-bisphosphate phosphatase
MRALDSCEPPCREETVFLDRDGVINEKMPEGQYVRSPAEFRVLPGVPEAIQRLNRAGIRVIIVSNQRGISLGLYTAEDLERIHLYLREFLQKRGARVDAYYFCPHDKGKCNCRKPLPGMFEQAVRDFPNITAETSAMIGDSLSDIEFGRRLGMQTIFLEEDPSRRRAGAEKAAALADRSFHSLSEAVDGLIGRQGGPEQN